MSRRNNTLPIPVLSNSMTAHEAITAFRDYLLEAQQVADRGFTEAAEKAVFNPDLRIDAVHKRGVKDGIHAMTVTINSMLNNTNIPKG